MIIYFANRHMDILGLASTNLPNGYIITEDLKTEEIETGVATFSCRIGFNDENRKALEAMMEAGNYLLRSHEDENEFYTIIDSEIDTKSKSIYVYAEDAGLDLINEIVGEFEATESYNSNWYFEKYLADSGFEIGINEIPAKTVRKLKWEGEETTTARLASIATQFGGYEISYSFDIEGLLITNKYINIHKERGKDTGVTLRLNRDIDRIVTSKSVANLATAFVCEGGVPDNAEEPITLDGYEYDDGDFFVDGNKLKSRNANKKWSRYVWNKEPNLLEGGFHGYIVRPYSYDTTDQETLCSHAIAELKKVCDMEVNYKIDIHKLPDGVKIGDRINIVDDAGELYASSRILLLESSIVDQTFDATLGEHLIKTSGISQKVMELAEQFAKNSLSTARALSIANNANQMAEAAQQQVEQAIEDASKAQAKANEAAATANLANQSASAAQQAANEAKGAVGEVVETVSGMEKAIDEAEALAKSAQESAEIATAQSAEAKVAASNAAQNANEAKAAAEEATALANSASTKADTASSQAEEAKTAAQTASNIAAAAKLDSEQAKKDVEEFSDNLETFEKTLTANYARKTDLTETAARFEAKITENANQLQITHEKVVTIDETANDAKKYADEATKRAEAAQATANLAAADADAAQEIAEEAQVAANEAQSQATTAQQAANEAQAVADQATTNLATAKANLESVKNRADATEEEIAAAQALVDTAQQAADKANEDAAIAAKEAEEAQITANVAVEHATNVKAVADKAKLDAEAAQAIANATSAAQQTANEANTKAENAQSLANTAVSNAANAQAKADQAALDATNAQQVANEADAKALQAQTDLNTAKQNLAATIARVDATEEEIALAEKAVEDAQKAADDAQEAADAAQDTANTAKDNAATAQAKADEAKTAADNAKKAADEAKEAADKAQSDVDALVVRVENAFTEIQKSNKEIALRAKKTEVDAIVVGGRNLIIRSTEEDGYYIGTDGSVVAASACSICDYISIEPNTDYMFTKTTGVQDNYFRYAWYDADKTYIGRAPNDNNEFLWTSPSNAHFIRISYPTECQVKFEKGNKATDWEPAPEDVDSKFLNYNTKEETESKMSIMAGNITSTVTQETDDKLDGLKTSTMTEIQQLKDNLSMLVVGKDGSSMMEQTEDGWSFKFGGISDDIESIKENLAKNAQYITFGEVDDGNGGKEPCIELGVRQIDETTGEVSSGLYKVLITNTRIIFKEGSATPTYISKETLVSEKVEVTQELHHTNAAVQGSFVWKMRPNGNFGLSWKGVIE